ncbi:cell division protein ZapD [Colwellia hornerae]|uniref:Cell division protein ZapD n=1 Tax=Colwellia hornerae TaxID=89402 RepID=A0A5C6QTN9_9GAMM|nr:cell division protein ZapD [Colwellia hornerae]TWX56931.1 cell division protein ZapD [Colwellia hornerae]TWX62344.1 cell division protein ZapD [Colwellia hornerae]TWX72324.1 cell division protein ZapD [Colwellia hornerae]
MTKILYEHPLNERTRNYLKLEHLFAQAQDCLQRKISVSHQVFFNALFAIIDTLERNDVRGDLIKDLEKLEQNLVIWSQAPEIDDSILAENLQQTVELICLLKPNTPLWAQLKHDKFLATLKQRFAMQGGSSSFDLPQLQFWLHQDSEILAKDVQGWLGLLEQIKSALDMILKFIRQRAEFKQIDTESGFYQDNGEGILLLRIKVDEKSAYYPTVSGNRLRYSIRFMSLCDKTGRKYSNKATSFQLARC